MATAADIHDESEHQRASVRDLRARGQAGGGKSVVDAADLASSEQQTRKLFDATMEAGKLGMWDWTVKTGRVEWSPALEAIHGREPGSFKGTIEDALCDVHPDDEPALREVLRSALEDGAEYHTTYRILTPDGEERWIETRGAVLRGADGMPERMAGVCSDITRRKLTEEQLYQSELRYRRLLQTLPAALYTCDTEGRITLYNDAAAELWGRKPELGVERWSGAHRVIAPDGREVPVEESPIALTMRDGVAVRGAELIIERPDGTRRSVLPHPEPLFDASGRVSGVVNMLVDITAVREAAEAVRNSEERFRHLADASPTLIWLAGVDKRCNWLNKPWLHFRGRSMEQETLDRWSDGVHPDDVGEVVGRFEQAFDARQEFQMEYRLRRADGQYRWVLDAGRPLHGPGGTFTGYVGSCVDVTDQVLARQSLEKQQALLEDAVIARTRELQLSNERLRIAERMASLGTLSAGLGHDMGNLLVPVRVRLESLSQANLPPAVQEDVEAIRSAAVYLQRLASGLRMLAVDPAAAAPGEVTDLAPWWEEVAPLLRNVVPRGVTIESNLGASSIRLAVPRATLTQMVFNMVQNAGDAMKARGTGEVHVAATESAPGMVTLRIRDDGQGMSPEIRTRCMEPFFTTRTRSLSTGLGLSLVYSLVEKVGGSIYIDSTEGVGTTFELQLPSASEGMRTANPGKGKKAVVRIQDPRMKAFVCAELKAMDFEAVVAGGDEHGAHLVVCDEESAEAHADDPTSGGDLRRARTKVVLSRKQGIASVREALGTAGRVSADAN